MPLQRDESPASPRPRVKPVGETEWRDHPWKEYNGKREGGRKGRRKKTAGHPMPWHGMGRLTDSGAGESVAGGLTDPRRHASAVGEGETLVGTLE